MTHFVIDVDQDDADVLASLISSPGYAHDYASPFQSESAPFGKPVHGRWVLSEIDVGRFEPSTAGRTEADLHRWANEQDWTDPEYRQPPEVMHQLGAVYSLLRVGNIYKLRNPGPEAEHDYGDVTGGLGFHEFVVIDRANADLHVIVASND
ncbi:hypothetical protein [Phycicoccus sp. Soil803]|uniref:hypothetical protein n=1 Tax=Phycicoccus sp. Soil803 TaxID=1736415 RepID=UPI00070CF100|nr:hypothetical protein [Phycicoccus sp. Soil803]KRF24363.1 hypothetical protein ASG95_07315 [Phycicoccus sp. Soil803]